MNDLDIKNPIKTDYSSNEKINTFVKECNEALESKDTRVLKEKFENLLKELYNESNINKSIEERMRYLTNSENAKYTPNDVIDFIATRFKKMNQRPDSMSEDAFDLINNNDKESEDRRTIVKYIFGGCVDKSPKERKQMFKLCFALEWNDKEAQDFFENVYCDKFLTKCTKELAYISMLTGNFDEVNDEDKMTRYMHAKHLIYSVKSKENSSGKQQMLSSVQKVSLQLTGSEYTSVIVDSLKSSTNRGELIEGIREHSKNLEELGKKAREKISSSKEIDEIVKNYKGKLEDLMAITSLGNINKSDLKPFKDLDNKIVDAYNSFPTGREHTRKGNGNNDIDEVNWRCLRSLLMIYKFCEFFIIENKIDSTSYFKEINEKLDETSCGQLSEYNFFDLIFIISAKTINPKKACEILFGKLSDILEFKCYDLKIN